MIPNPILFNDNLIMTGLMACCLIVLAIVMVPKAIRHRKQVKQNESEKEVPNKEQEVEMIVVPSGKPALEQSMVDYKRRFLINVNISTRSGKLVSIREKYHKRITKVVRASGKKDVSIFSYIDNVLSHHFDTYRNEINETCNKDKEDDDYFKPE